jgi:hypothetical protein
LGDLNERVSGDYKSKDSVSQGAGYHWTTLRQKEAERCARKDRGLKVPNPGNRIPTAYIRDDLGRVVASLAGRLRSPEHEGHGGLAFDFQLASVTVDLSHLPLGLMSTTDTRGTSKDTEMVGSALLEQHRAFVDAVVNRCSEQRRPVSALKPRQKRSPKAKSHRTATTDTGGVIADTASATMDQSTERHKSTIMHRIVTNEKLERIFLAVEQENFEAVIGGGYCAQRRKNIAVSRTMEDAEAGCRKWHPDSDAVVIFEVLRSQQINAFETPSGALRLNCNHLPARLLRVV